MPGQEINEILVRVSADTRSAEADLKRLGQERDKALSSSPTPGSSPVPPIRVFQNARTEAQQGAFNAREARRDIREQLALIKEDISKTASFTAGKSVIDALFNVDQDRAKATRLAGTIQDLRAQLEKGAITQKQYNQEAAKPQADLDALAKKYSGLSGTVRGLSISMVGSLATTLQVAASLAVMQAVIDGAGQTMRDFLDPTRRTADAMTNLSNVIRGLGGEKGLVESLGMDSRAAAQLAAFARNLDAVNKAAQLRLAQLKLETEAAGSGVNPQSPELPLEIRARQAATQRLTTREAGFTAGAFRNPILAPLAAGSSLGGNILASLFGIEGGASALSATIKATLNTAEFDSAYKEELAKLREAAQGTLRTAAADSAKSLIEALQRGEELDSRQLETLRLITTEEERQAVLAASRRVDQARLNDALQRQADLQENIAILQGRASGDVNKDQLAAIEVRRTALDRREKAMEERAFRRERAQKLAELEGAIARAGISQAGQTALDVFAAQREAEAQAAGARAQMQDEDARRAIAAERERLNVAEKAIRTRMQLETELAALRLADDAVYFAQLSENTAHLTRQQLDAIAAIGTAALTTITAITAKVGTQEYFTQLANLLGRDAVGGRYAIGGGINKNVPVLVGEMGPELFVPQGNGTIVPNATLRAGGATTTIVIEAAPVILDGAVVGKMVERRVTARAGQRAALGVF
jgi:hypothetical protein